MKRAARITVYAVLLVAAFIGGALYRHPVASSPARRARVLYYRDPMHPSYVSDKPGTAPDCGMALEPVYAAGDESAQRTAGADEGQVIRVSPDLQSTLGIVLERVRKGPVTHTMRTPGKVTLDESRIYPLTAGADGWVKDVFPITTGTTVHKGQPLVSVCGRDFLTAQRTFLYALRAAEAGQPVAATREYQDQPAFALEESRLNLEAIGMGEAQIQQITRERKPLLTITLGAPRDGIVVQRNAYPEQRFSRGAELFRIADLERVWVVTEVFGDQAPYIHAGEAGYVSSPSLAGKSFRARVSVAQPPSYASTQSIEVRLEVENPGSFLRPDMVVNVDFPQSATAVTVPSDAVIDSGTKKMVFVARGDQAFEPRQVKTGRHFGDRVEILDGLDADERIVTAGNFLLDSENRIHSARDSLHHQP